MQPVTRRQPSGVVVSLIVSIALAMPALGSQGEAGAAAGLRPHVGQPVAPTVFIGDVRDLPRADRIGHAQRPELRAPNAALQPEGPPAGVQLAPPAAPAPAASVSFAGLNHDDWGEGWPPDTNGDVGPDHYVQTVNTSVGIYSKTGTELAAFTFNSLFSSAATGTPCDDSNQGDPVVVYDPLDDHWIISDFAWSNFATGPFYQCFAVSMSGDPVSGGWYFYAVETDGGAHIPDYPKLGVWPDGIYMSANVFNSSGAETYQHVRVWAFNRDDLESGAVLRSVSFDLPAKIQGIPVFSLLPSNLRGAAPPAGRPNLFASIFGTYRLRVWKFHVDWGTPTNSTFTGPSDVVIDTFAAGPSTVPELNGNDLDTLTYRVMMQNQYRFLGGQESLWLAHTVGTGGSPNVAAVRWYQVSVTGGTVTTSAPVQQGTWSPNSTHRFMPSLAVDGSGNMAIGYSLSSASTYPAIAYAGRLAGDPLDTLGQGETVLVAGTGAQTNNCGGAPCIRWGDYSAMSVDPVDDCTFWYTNEYYVVSGGNWQTRIGAFAFPGCGVPVVSPPTPRLFVPSRLGTDSVRVRVKWSGSDASGIVSYELMRSVNSGPWESVDLPTPTATSLTQSLLIGDSYRYRVRASDDDNTSAWAAGPRFVPRVAQQSQSSVSYQGSWTTVAGSAFSGGSLAYATAAGAEAEHTFTGSSVAWVAHRGPTRGSAEVYLDGVLQGTVSLYSPTAQSRTIAFVYNWGSEGTHTIRVVAVGTPEHPRIDVDAFVKLDLL